MNKYFPVWVHIVLACVVTGIAVGLKQDGVRYVYQYGTNGLAFGLGLTAFFRLLTGN